MSDKIAENVEELISGVESYLEEKYSRLTYTNLRFRLKTVPVPSTDELSDPLEIFYSVSHGSVTADRAQIDRAIERSGLSPGDTTITAYRTNGSNGPVCESISKVLSFQTDGITPKKLLHVWPNERPNKALTSAMLWGREIEDERIVT